MRIIANGHVYEMNEVGETGKQYIRFIRSSTKAVEWEHDHPGLNTQEVLRVLIDRTKMLNDVLPCGETTTALYHLRLALYFYEVRAWRRKRQKLNKEQPAHVEEGEPPFRSRLIEHYPVCPQCGHIFCIEHDPLKKEREIEKNVLTELRAGRGI